MLGQISVCSQLIVAHYKLNSRPPHAKNPQLDESRVAWNFAMRLKTRTVARHFALDFSPYPGWRPKINNTCLPKKHHAEIPVHLSGRSPRLLASLSFQLF